MIAFVRFDGSVISETDPRPLPVVKKRDRRHSVVLDRREKRGKTTNPRNTTRGASHTRPLRKSRGHKRSKIPQETHTGTTRNTDETTSGTGGVEKR